MLITLNPLLATTPPRSFGDYTQGVIRAHSFSLLLHRHIHEMLLLHSRTMQADGLLCSNNAIYLIIPRCLLCSNITCVAIAWDSISSDKYKWATFGSIRDIYVKTSTIFHYSLLTLWRKHVPLLLWQGTKKQQIRKPVKPKTSLIYGDLNVAISISKGRSEAKNLSRSKGATSKWVTGDTGSISACHCTGK